jgi:hypothetical protein
MFLGHFAVAFAAKRAAPEVSLGTLFLAAQLADLLWPNLVLLGVERFKVQPGITAVTPLDFVHYPWSHSLTALALWGVVLGVGWVAVRLGQATPKAALVILAVVVSQWVLDWIAHRPDRPLTIGVDTRLGLGLWHSIPATFAVEGGLFALCVAFYAQGTRAVDRIGTWAFWGLVAFLVVVYAATVFGPPPEPAHVAWAAQAMWLLVFWGYWIDRHREKRKYGIRD